MQPFAISTDCRLVKVKDSTANGAGDVTSDSVDMAQDGGYNGVIFFTNFATPAANNKGYAQYSDDNFVTPLDVAGSLLAPGASDGAQFVDIIRPASRYVRSVWQRGTSTVLGEVWALLYRARKVPVPAKNVVAGTMMGKTLVNPVAGVK